MRPSCYSARVLALLRTSGSQGRGVAHAAAGPALLRAEVQGTAGVVLVLLPWTGPAVAGRGEAPAALLSAPTRPPHADGPGSKAVATDGDKTSGKLPCVQDRG